MYATILVVFIMKKNDAETIEIFRFFIAGECYGVSIAQLLEIAEPTAVAPLPFSKPYVDGLINISGQMIMQLDASILLGAKKPCSQQALLVVDVEGEPFALTADSLGEPLVLAKNRLQDAKTLTAGELNVQQVESCKVIETAQIKRLFTVNRVLPSNTNQAMFQHDWQEQAREQEHDFLHFRLEKKSFAMGLTDLLEIVDIQSLQPLAKSPALIKGVSLLRGQPRLLLHLSQLLGLDKPVAGMSALIVFYQGYVLGLMVDEALGVLKIPESNLRFDDRNVLAAVDYQGKPVEVLDVKALLSASIMQQLKPFLTLAKEQKAEQVAYRELIVVQVAGETFAVPLAYASRISYQGDLSPLPEARGFIYATMEFQGSVIPVIDLPRLLGLEQVETLALEYLVVSCAGQYWALKIDTSLRIVEVPETTMSYTESSDGYLLGYCQVDENLLSVLNIDNICLVDDANASALRQ